MSDVAAVAAPPATGHVPAVSGGLQRVRRIGYLVLGLQLAGFLVWSAIIDSRFALTADAVLDPQAWFQIAHGHLNPHDYGFPSAWRDHSEFLLWPMALLYWLWPHSVTLLWVQDLCLVGAEAVAFTWLCEIAGRCRRGRDAAWLAGAGLVLLAANPWMWWTVAWDFHMQPVSILFTVLIAWDLANERRRAWIWVAPLLACGDVAASYLVGLGLGAVLLRRDRWRSGVTLACLGLAALLLITLVHGNSGSHIQDVYGYLAGRPAGSPPPSLPGLVAGTITHPQAAARMLWARRVDVWANLAPSGIIGLGFPPVLPLTLVVMLADELHPGLNIAEPLFQAVPVYVLVPVGTVAVLAWLTRRSRRMALVLAAGLAAQTLGWAAVWEPRTPEQWLRVPAATAATLARVQARIPPSAEVIASQGVIGRFYSLPDLKAIWGPGTIPIDARQTWWIVVPITGVEKETTGNALALIAELAGPLHATLVAHANGVWAFRWQPPPGLRKFTMPGESVPLMAWSAPVTPGEAGRPVMSGPPATWHMTALKGRGYVADGLAWQELPGRYEAMVSLSAVGPVNVEVWDDTGNVLLARQRVPATAGVETITLPVDATDAYPPRIFPGWGPFQARFDRPLPGERLEVRVWSPGGHRVNVYSAQLVSAASGPGALPGEGG